jgi:hypothetical protein
MDRLDGTQVAVDGAQIRGGHAVIHSPRHDGVLAVIARRELRIAFIAGKGGHERLFAPHIDTGFRVRCDIGRAHGTGGNRVEVAAGKIHSGYRLADIVSRICPLKKTLAFSAIILYNDTMLRLNKKHKVTLFSIFQEPIRADVNWDNIESLILALGGEISEGSGSRIRFFLNGIRAVFHRPHPQRVTDKGALKSVRRFLMEAGINHVEV